ncbi:MAG: IS4 family transposase [Planctomycetota bacterium]
MRLRKALACVAEIPRPETFEDFRRHVDPVWIQDALEATGAASLRRRRLPAEQVIWLVLGMALFRDQAIVDVADSLNIALPSRRGPAVSHSAVIQARERLGEEPMQWLFETCAHHWAHQSADLHRWRGLALYGVDGTTLRIPDSAENRGFLGAPGPGPRGQVAYPQVRLVALMALRSHLIATASFGPYTLGEHSYARALWSQLPDQSLCILDRNFFAANVILPLSSGGTSRHWLMRAKKGLKWRVLEQLGQDNYRVEMTVSRPARRKDPSLPEHFELRALRYQLPGFQPQWLLTSLMDPKAYPAREIVVLYYERWEIELAFDEIKTEMLDREEAIRSRRPPRIRQEIWGILLAYNLVRLEMERVADEAGVPPYRISFLTSLHLICDEWIWSASASPGAIPRHLRRLRAALKRFILPPRRPERRYPRAVKIKMSSYPKKRRTPADEAAK